MTKVLGLLLLVTLACAACAVDDTLKAPYCERSGSGLIEAQSVPSAELIPCITELPDGWTVDTVSINQDRTIIHLDSDRAGDDAAVLHYGQSCEIGDAVSVPADDPRIERYDDSERIDPDFRAAWYYRVEGGCWWWQFEFVEGASATLAVEVADSLGWISRDDLNASFGESFIDKEL